MTTLEAVATALDVPPERVADIVTVVLFQRVCTTDLDDWETITDPIEQSLYMAARARLRNRLNT